MGRNSTSRPSAQEAMPQPRQRKVGWGSGSKEVEGWGVGGQEEEFWVDDGEEEGCGADVREKELWGDLKGDISLLLIHEKR